MNSGLYLIFNSEYKSYRKVFVKPCSLMESDSEEECCDGFIKKKIEIKSIKIHVITYYNNGRNFTICLRG